MSASRCLAWIEHNLHASTSERKVVVETTQYLRMGRAAGAVGRGAAVVVEHARSGSGGRHCWQESISAYYYTPAGAFFVAALVTIGISLIALKGSTEIEDVLLNCAGFFAPVVAFVPTPNRGRCGVITDTANRNLNIANNITAMLIMAGVALVVLAALKVRSGHVPGGGPGPARRVARRIARVGFALAVVLYAGLWAVFEGNRTWFAANAHSTAAITMFAFIFLVVADNAVNLYWTRSARGGRVHVLNRYSWIAIAMVAGFAAVAIRSRVATFSHATIWLETVMITLFVIFWVTQTHELWHAGLRRPRRPGVPVTPAADRERVLTAATQ